LDIFEVEYPFGEAPEEPWHPAFADVAAHAQMTTPRCDVLRQR
jgi:hypothetical protein